MWGPTHSYSPQEFEREARRIDAITFETLALSPGESVVFCGFTAGGDYVRRAKELGCKVAVIEAREHVIREYADLGVRTIRGSTSVIPARDNAFDIAVAAGYLHEVDPSFHAHIVSELARVARRVGVIELAPPTDPLGRRIAALYSRAKQELGSFEHYQPLEYWKKLMAMVKADISQSIFQFAKLPPIEYLIDTVDLLLDTIEAEEAPEEDLEELRRIAQRSNAMLLPQARLVLIGAATGQIPTPMYSDIATGLDRTRHDAPLAGFRAGRRAARQPQSSPNQRRPNRRFKSPLPPSRRSPRSRTHRRAACDARDPPRTRLACRTPSPQSHRPFRASARRPSGRSSIRRLGRRSPCRPRRSRLRFTPSAGPTAPGWTWEPPEDDLA